MFLYDRNIVEVFLKRESKHDRDDNFTSWKINADDKACTKRFNLKCSPRCDKAIYTRRDIDSKFFRYHINGKSWNKSLLKFENVTRILVSWFALTPRFSPFVTLPYLINSKLESQKFKAKPKPRKQKFVNINQLVVGEKSGKAVKKTVYRARQCRI